jgi:hypothetical protein
MKAKPLLCLSCTNKHHALSEKLHTKQRSRKDNEGLTHGVIGNTTDFGSVESKFEP